MTINTNMTSWAILFLRKWARSFTGMNWAERGRARRICVNLGWSTPVADSMVLRTFTAHNRRTMKFEKIHNKGQAQLFRNQYLEMLTKTHPLVIWGMYIPIISYFLYYSYDTLENSLARIGLIFLAGMFFWTF